MQECPRGRDWLQRKAPQQSHHGGRQSRPKIEPCSPPHQQQVRLWLDVLKNVHQHVIHTRKQHSCDGTAQGDAYPSPHSLVGAIDGLLLVFSVNVHERADRSAKVTRRTGSSIIHQGLHQGSSFGVLESAVRHASLHFATSWRLTRLPNVTTGALEV